MDTCTAIRTAGATDMIARRSGWRIIRGRAANGHMREYALGTTADPVRLLVHTDMEHRIIAATHSVTRELTTDHDVVRRWLQG